METNTQQGQEKSEAVISKEIFAEQNEKIASLEKELAAEKQAHLSTMQINEGLQSQIEGFDANAKKLEKESKVIRVPEKSFKVGKVDYVFTVPSFLHPDVFSEEKDTAARKLLSAAGRKTAEEALSDKDLLEYLVKEKSGVIKRKGDK